MGIGKRLKLANGKEWELIAWQCEGMHANLQIHCRSFLLEITRRLVEEK